MDKDKEILFDDYTVKKLAEMWANLLLSDAKPHLEKLMDESFKHEVVHGFSDGHWTWQAKLKDFKAKLTKI